MPKVIAVASKSTRLIISLQNEDCDLSISEDRTVLFFVKTSENPIHRMILELNGKDNNVIEKYDILCERGGRKDSVRIDAVLRQYVFKDAEPDSTVLEYSDYWVRAEHSIYFLRINLSFERLPDVQSKLPVNDMCGVFGIRRGGLGFRTIKLPANTIMGLPSPALAKIATTNLLIEATTVPVSKEVVELNSNFFARLFNANMKEKETGIYQLKEVNAEDFRWMINFVQYRTGDITKVEQVIIALSLADYFDMPLVHNRVLPFLENVELFPTNTTYLKRLLALRCFDKPRLVSIIFDRCESSRELVDVANSQSSVLSEQYIKFLEVLQARHAKEEQLAEEEKTEQRRYYEEQLLLEDDSKLRQELREEKARQGERYYQYQMEYHFYKS